MRNAKNVLFWQVDHQIKKILAAKGVVILPSAQAWGEFEWTKRLFKKKPKEGYFVWVKEQINFPLSTCFTIASPKVIQDLANLLIIEKNIKVKAGVVCHADRNDLCGTHKAKGRVILKENVELEYQHLHWWGKKDFVSPDYEFILKKNSQLNYNYKNLLPPATLDLKTTIHTGQRASSNLNVVINGMNTKIMLEEAVFLKGEGARGMVRLRLVGKKDSQIEAKSSIIAKAAGKGHLDCQGLLVDKDSTISLMPELVCENRKAQITHEASIGRISEEQLNYLRMRGLTEREAVDLIVNGFLTKE